MIILVEGGVASSKVFHIASFPEPIATKYHNQLTGSGDGHLIASHDNDTLSRKELLGNNTGETTEKVVTTVNNLGC
jgi:hypothetical protein